MQIIHWKVALPEVMIARRSANVFVVDCFGGETWAVLKTLPLAIGAGRADWLSCLFGGEENPRACRICLLIISTFILVMFRSRVFLPRYCLIWLQLRQLGLVPSRSRYCRAMSFQTWLAKNNVNNVIFSEPNQSRVRTDYPFRGPTTFFQWCDAMTQRGMPQGEIGPISCFKNIVFRIMHTLYRGYSL